MSFQTLITASELDHLCRTETDVVILDARFHLDDEDWGIGRSPSHIFPELSEPAWQPT